MLEPSQRTPNVWGVRANSRQLANKFREGGYASIGWSLQTNLAQNISDEAIEQAYLAANSNPDPPAPVAAANVCSQIRLFLNEIQLGDQIVTPTAGSKWLQYGTATGDPYYEENPQDLNHHRIRRRVKWSSERLYRYAQPLELQKAMRDRRTVFALADDPSRLESTATAVQGSKAAAAFSPMARWVLEKIIALEPKFAEDLFGALLAAMGCDRVCVVGRPNDGGVDVLATTGDILAPETHLFVQVKRYQLDREIGKKAVRDLRARIPFGGRGVFVTTSSYVKGAAEVASDSMFPHISLINGSQLVDLLLKHRADLPEEFREALGL